MTNQKNVQKINNNNNKKQNINTKNKTKSTT